MLYCAGGAVYLSGMSRGSQVYHGVIFFVADEAEKADAPKETFTPARVILAANDDSAWQMRGIQIGIEGSEEVSTIGAVGWVAPTPQPVAI